MEPKKLKRGFLQLFKFQIVPLLRIMKKNDFTNFDNRTKSVALRNSRSLNAFNLQHMAATVIMHFEFSVITAPDTDSSEGQGNMLKYTRSRTKLCGYPRIFLSENHKHISSACFSARSQLYRQQLDCNAWIIMMVAHRQYEKSSGGRMAFRI